MEKNIFKRVASLALAVVMMLSVLVVVNPQEAKAADLGTTIKNATKTKTVTITDEQAYGSSGQFYWIKFKAKKDGYVTVKAENASVKFPYAYGGWALFDKNKKKQLSTMMEFNTSYTDSYYYTDYYGIKKGSTYNLKVQAAAGTKITFTFKDVKENCGSKQKNAKALKKGKEVTGLFIAGKQSSDWYKVSLNKEAYLRFDMKVYVGDKVQVKVKGPGIYTTTKTYNYTSNGNKLPLRWGTSTKEQKVRKGTYYIQVKPLKKTTTGAYKLKWK